MSMIVTKIEPFSRTHWLIIAQKIAVSLIEHTEKWMLRFNWCKTSLKIDQLDEVGLLGNTFNLYNTEIRIHTED